MKRTVYKGSVVLTDQIVEQGVVAVEHGRIIYAGAEGGYSYGGDEQLRDYSGCWIMPGLIDIHVHGSNGCDVMDGTREALQTISKSLCRYGVTGFLATTMAAPLTEVERVTAAVAALMAEGVELDAQLLGVHLEGPWLNPRMKGAQSEEHICNPGEQQVEAVLHMCGEHLRVVTIAPELPGALAAIRRLSSQGIVCSIGHTDATAEQVEAAIAHGATHCTHLFNAMRGLHHREPGVVGTALVKRQLSCDMIADLVHVHPHAVELAYHSKGRERLFLISDGMRAVGMSDGSYELGGQTVNVVGCIARLSDGTLAGSTLTLNQAVRNMVETLGISVSDAVYMAATGPAEKIGWGSQKGSLDAGKDADLVIMAKDFTVLLTVVQGRVVFREGENRP